MENKKQVFGASGAGVGGIEKKLVVILILAGGAGLTDGHPTLQCAQTGAGFANAPFADLGLLNLVYSIGVSLNWCGKV